MLPFTHGDIPPPELDIPFSNEVMIHAKRLTLGVEDSLFVMSADVPGWSLPLPVDGGSRSVVQDSTGFEFQVSLTWRGETPVVQRSFGADGRILDAFEITEPDVLIVTRTLRWGLNQSRNSRRFVYVREGST